MAARFIRYTLDGIKLTHDIGFGVTDDEGFDVYVNRTKLDKDVDYKVNGTDEQLRNGDGTITLTAVHAASDVLLILSDTLARRVTNFAKAARFEEAEVDNEFDNLLRLLEDAALNLQSTPYFSPPDIGLVNGELPPIIAGGVLRVNAAKNGFELVELDKVPEFENALQQVTQQADRAEREATRAESKANEATQIVNGFDQHAESKKTEVTNAGDQKIEIARKWAEGDTPSGDQPSDTNNAKHFSESSSASAQSSEQSNQGAAQGKELARKWAEGDTPSGDQPSDTNNAKHFTKEAEEWAKKAQPLEVVTKFIDVNSQNDVTVNQTYEIDIASEVGAGFLDSEVIVVAEAFNNTGTGIAAWGECPFQLVSEAAAGASYGVKATVRSGKIVVVTALTGIVTAAGLQGNPFGSTAVSATTKCRVKVIAIKK